MNSKTTKKMRKLEEFPCLKAEALSMFENCASFIRFISQLGFFKYGEKGDINTHSKRKKKIKKKKKTKLKCKSAGRSSKIIKFQGRRFNLIKTFALSLSPSSAIDVSIKLITLIES